MRRRGPTSSVRRTRADCPGCRTQLEVEAVPPGYPVIFDFEPDLETFYREWLGREL